MIQNGKDKKKMLPPKNGFCSAKKEDAPQNPFFGSAFFFLINYTIKILFK